MVIDEKVLIEELEEAGKYHLELSEANKMDVRESHRHKQFAGVYGHAIQIVKDLASEHNNGFCEWEMIDEEANVYDTTCRNPHILLEGSPTDNNYEFCPYCGKEIKVITAPYKKGE